MRPVRVTRARLTCAKGTITIICGFVNVNSCHPQLERVCDGRLYSPGRYGAGGSLAGGVHGLQGLCAPRVRGSRPETFGNPQQTCREDLSRAVSTGNRITRALALGRPCAGWHRRLASAVSRDTSTTSRSRVTAVFRCSQTIPYFARSRMNLQPESPLADGNDHGRARNEERRGVP